MGCLSSFNYEIGTCTPKETNSLVGMCCLQMWYVLPTVNFNYCHHVNNQKMLHSKTSRFLDSLQTQDDFPTPVPYFTWQQKAMKQPLLLQIIVFATVHFSPYLDYFVHSYCLSGLCKHLILSPVLFIKECLDLVATFFTHSIWSQKSSFQILILKLG